MDNTPISKGLLPDSPASGQFTAWLNAFNTHCPETLLAYHKAYFPYDFASADVKNIDMEIALSQATGGFDVVDVLNSPDLDETAMEDALHIILQERKRKHYVRVLMYVDSRVSGNPVTKFDINPTHTPIKDVPEDQMEEYKKALRTLTPGLRRKIVEDISLIIRKQYIFSDISEKMIHNLNTNAKDDGEYESYQDSELFAQRLTADLQAVSQDTHVRVHFREPGNISPGNEGKNVGKVFDDLRTKNFGFGDTYVESVGDKAIGFLAIHGFVPSTTKFASDFAAVREAISDILTQVAHTDALIIDLRANRGGHPDTVAFILSYLLDSGPVHLLDMVDCDGTIKFTFSTLPISDLPRGALRFGGSKPLFVLTSKSTISGGEDMAYGLQAFGRAKAIIGEDQSTAGAANPVMNPKFICEKEFGRGWWWVGVPDLRPVHSVTGLNWEGVGVKSDVVASEMRGNAKDIGRRMALEALGVGEC